MQIGFAGLLTLIFIVLKLTGVVAWSWLWVLSPLWIGFIIVTLILIGCAVFAIGSKNTFKSNNRKFTK